MDILILVDRQIYISMNFEKNWRHDIIWIVKETFKISSSNISLIIWNYNWIMNGEVLLYEYYILIYSGFVHNIEIKNDHQEKTEIYRYLSVHRKSHKPEIVCSHGTTSLWVDWLKEGLCILMNINDETFLTSSLFRSLVNIMFIALKPRSHQSYFVLIHTDSFARLLSSFLP